MRRSDSIFRDFLSDAPGSQKPRNRLILWTSFLLAAILLYLTLRGLDWAAFFESLRRANYFYISLMLLWSSVTYFLRAMRWRVLLNSQKQLSPAGVFWANMAGYLGNNILPARAGEIVRAAYVSRREGIPIVFVLATGFTERLVDLAALVVIGSVSVLFAVAFSTSMQEAFKSFAIIAVIGVAFIFLHPHIVRQSHQPCCKGHTKNNKGRSIALAHPDNNLG